MGFLGRRAAWPFALGLHGAPWAPTDWDSGSWIGTRGLSWDMVSWIGMLVAWNVFCGLGLLFRVSGLEGWASGLLNENGCYEIVWLPLAAPGVACYIIV